VEEEEEEEDFQGWQGLGQKFKCQYNWGQQ
jgi:hypothetical protein